MSAVTLQEIMEALIHSRTLSSRLLLADRIEAHGIAPTDADANGCSTHPKARHGFARQASHSSDEYVCECAGFDPYEAGYQAGLSAAWDADGALLPDGMVLVPMEPTQEMIDAGIMFGTSPTKVSIIWGSMLAAAPEVKP